MKARFLAVAFMLSWCSGDAMSQGASSADVRAAEGSTTAAAASDTTLRTRYAQFLPAEFDVLPGWRQDDLTEAWKAFRASCSALASRAAWSEMCGRAASVPPRNAEIRQFFEREFVLYQIRNPDQSAAGIITGYYEPLLNGSRRRGGRFLYPVYGVPDDMLYFDARTSSSARSGDPVYVRVSGRNAAAVPATSGGHGGLYLLDVADARPDVRDRKMRVRIDGDRIVPYYTRAQIEEQGSKAEVLAWVDDASALYSMQIQGSGKVKLPDGQVVRLAYGDQNGHPFLPPVLGAARPGQPGPRLPQTRGIPLQVSLAADAPMTRGLNSAARSGPVDLSADVARVIDILLHGSPATASSEASRERPRQEQSGAERSRPSSTGGRVGSSWFSSDPSYVFFREVQDSPAGPIGALGVPLTAGRSIAVDPRTTPLGFPVFVSARQADGGGPLNRLMVAQDTGGAIRGAVRADYFWGFGPTAGERAARMKQVGSMWLLVPKSQPLPARVVQSATRGLGRPGESDAECVVPDPEMCVE